MNPDVALARGFPLGLRPSPPRGKRLNSSMGLGGGILPRPLPRGGDGRRASASAASHQPRSRTRSYSASRRRKSALSPGVASASNCPTARSTRFKLAK